MLCMRVDVHSIWILMFERVFGRLFSLDILSRLASQDKWFSTVLLGHKTLNFHQYIFWKAGCKWHIILHRSDKSWNIWGSIEIKQHSFVASNIRRQLPGGKGINLGHQEEEAHPVGGNRRICNPKIRKNSKKWNLSDCGGEIPDCQVSPLRKGGLVEIINELSSGCGSFDRLEFKGILRMKEQGRVKPPWVLHSD